MIFDEL
jgi:folate-binding protein YgfZ